MEKEKQLLIKCRQLIEESLNWGDSGTWSNDDFEQLSEQIFDKTKVQLSVSTLKRIWGKVRYDNFPTTGTLNALAGFLNYSSWRDFRQKNEINEPTTVTGPDHKESASDESSGFTTASAKPTKSIRNVMLVAVFLVVISGIILISSKKEPASIDISKVKFEAVKVSDTLPNSVIFNYDASAFKSDSVFIQQSWDPKRRERVPGAGKQHTSIYYNPGYFIAKLIVDNKIKKEYIVSIKTKGWKGILETKPLPVYLAPREIKVNGCMGIAESTLREKTGSPVFNDTWVYFSNVREYQDIDSRNFTFETTLRNSSAVEASICRKVRVIILTESSAIVIPLAEKGCISELNLLTGDSFFSGKDYDLSAFGCDFSHFQNLQFSVRNQGLKIYLNSKLIREVGQKSNLGKIEGIRFEFEGTAEIKDVQLSTPGSGSYHYTFEDKNQESRLKNLDGKSPVRSY